MQSYFDKFKEPESAYRLFLKKAIDQSYLTEFEKHLKVEKYHENAINYFTL